MRIWIIALGICVFCFILPLQCYIIGNDIGMGIQGGVFRYQITGQGNSLIPITKELTYVSSGMYEGRTSLSVIFWALGTVVLTLMEILSLSYWDQLTTHHLRLITIGLVGAGISYLASCCFQYGLFLSGPSGISLPIGVVLMIIFAIFLHYYQDWILNPGDNHINTRK